MSTSKLQDYVSNKLNIHLGKYEIYENKRPDWLITENGARLELDFWMPELEIAIEVQGHQHDMFVRFFHETVENFEKRLFYDDFKRTICKNRCIELYEIRTLEEADDLIALILAKIENEGLHLPERDFMFTKSTIERIDSHNCRHIRMWSRYIMRQIKKKDEKGKEWRNVDQRIESRLMRIDKHLEKSDDVCSVCWAWLDQIQNAIIAMRVRDKQKGRI